MRAGRIAVAVAAVLVTASLAACSPSTSGTPSVARATSLAPESSNSLLGGPSSPATMPTQATDTVTVTAPASSASASTPSHRQAGVPQSPAALLRLYENSRPVDTPRFAVDGGLFFDEPSQNLGCFLSDQAYIVCSIHQYDFPQPGRDCPRGIAADLISSGDSALTSCDHYFPVAHLGYVLQYGQSISHDELACVSEATGVSCLSLNTDGGYTISREAFTQVAPG